MVTYTCNDMLVKIGTATIGVVTGLDIRLSKESAGIQYVYGSDAGVHVIGGNKGTFSLQRFYFADTDTDLLYDLFNDETPFSLSGEIVGLSNSQLTLSNCKGYTWRPVTGDANSAIGEEITGEGTSWSATLV